MILRQEVLTSKVVVAAAPLDGKIITIDVASRDAIPAIQRYHGMKVYVQSTSTEYILQDSGDLTNTGWSISSNVYTGASPSTVTVGGLDAGAVLTGKTTTELFEEMLVVYQTPTFSSAPTVSAPSSNATVEVGTTLTGTRTFAWTTTNPTNVEVNSIDIRDVTGAVDLATGLADDGSESGVTITTLQLSTNGATQQWRMEGVDTNALAFNSSNRTITARFYRFYGANAATPTNSAEVRALSSSDFQTSNGNTFNLATGSTLTKFVIALPPSRTISNVIDLDALSADITASYVLLSTMEVLDAGGVSQTYNLYEMNIGAPYAASHNHQITTA